MKNFINEQPPGLISNSNIAQASNKNLSSTMNS